MREEKKKITCASLIIILVTLFFVSLSRCCFFALSSNARSWEDKGKRNEMIFWTMGARDSLWDVVVKWDDICFKHILPRLDLNDVKFLYGVNTETRALIKRSTRANDLKEKFKVKRCRRYRLWSLRGSIIRGAVVVLGKRWTNHISAVKLLKRINSSCSSGRERRKSVSGMKDD